MHLNCCYHGATLSGSLLQQLLCFLLLFVFCHFLNFTELLVSLFYSIHLYSADICLSENPLQTLLLLTIHFLPLINSGSWDSTSLHVHVTWRIWFAIVTLNPRAQCIYILPSESTAHFKDMNCRVWWVILWKCSCLDSRGPWWMYAALCCLSSNFVFFCRHLLSLDFK